MPWWAEEILVAIAYLEEGQTAAALMLLKDLINYDEEDCGGREN